MSDIHEQIKEYYGQTLSGSGDLKTNACCCSTTRPPSYVVDALPLIADEIVEKFYGCGSPIPSALEGCTVVDLGCGTGRDSYVLSKLVGESGHVIGVDMTPEQLDVANRHLDEQMERFGYAVPNIEFRSGYIEDLAALGIKDNSVDLVVSNCVINLSPFKDQVFSEIYRVLKPGGELYFSDVFCDRRLTDELRADPILRGECLGGALYLGDFDKMMRKHGWASHLYTYIDEIHVGDLTLETKLGFTSFTSRTVRAIKATGLEETEENYSQTATYLGTIPETKRYFDLSDEIRLIRGRKCAISKNMAEMLKQSRYGKHFEITEPGLHTGRFQFEQAQEAVDIKAHRKKVDLEYLNRVCKRNNIPDFDEKVDVPEFLETHEHCATMQANVTYKCNLACRHCYLECSPANKEMMPRETMEKCIGAFRAGNFETMDITGGSPELNPEFKWFMDEASKIAKNVIVRTNLTLECLAEHEHYLKDFADAGVDVCVSLPYFSPELSDQQRGNGVFEKAVSNIKKLNALGYGKEGGLKLTIVYNVAGPFLPPPQFMIEEAYKVKLVEEQGIEFNDLYAFNNWPLGRFAHDLATSGLTDDYMNLLYDNFNPFAVGKIMCRDQVNVDYDGRLYDCECNHVLEMPIQVDERDATVDDLMNGQLPVHKVRTCPVCYSCSAGAGSSCGGSLV